MLLPDLDKASVSVKSFIRSLSQHLQNVVAGICDVTPGQLDADLRLLFLHLGRRETLQTSNGRIDLSLLLRRPDIEAILQRLVNLLQDENPALREPILRFCHGFFLSDPNWDPSLALEKGRAAILNCVPLWSWLLEFVGPLEKDAAVSAVARDRYRAWTLIGCLLIGGSHLALDDASPRLTLIRRAIETLKNGVDFEKEEINAAATTTHADDKNVTLVPSEQRKPAFDRGYLLSSLIRLEKCCSDTLGSTSELSSETKDAEETFVKQAFDDIDESEGCRIPDDRSTPIYAPLDVSSEEENRNDNLLAENERRVVNVVSDIKRDPLSSRDEGDDSPVMAFSSASNARSASDCIAPLMDSPATSAPSSLLPSTAESSSPRRVWILGAEVTLTEGRRDFGASLSLDRIRDKIASGMAVSVAGFLNAGIDGSILYGCYGFPTRKVRGVVVTSEQARDLKTDVSTLLGTIFDESRAHLYSIVQVLFHEVWPSENALKPILDCSLIEVRVHGTTNTGVFSCPILKGTRNVRRFPFREMTSENQALIRHLVTETEVIDARRRVRRRHKELGHEMSLPTRADPPEADFWPSISSRRRRQLRPLEVFVQGDPSPFRDDQNTILHREPSLDKVTEGELASCLLALFNANVVGVVIFGIYGVKGSDGDRVEGIHLTRDERDSFRLSVDDVVRRMRPTPNPRLFQVFFHPVAKRLEGANLSVIANKYVVEISVKSHDSNHFYESRIIKGPECFLHLPKMETPDVRVAKGRGHRIIYLRVGNRTIRVSVDEVSRRALSERREDWQSLFTSQCWKRRELLNGLEKP